MYIKEAILHICGKNLVYGLKNNTFIFSKAMKVTELPSSYDKQMTRSSHQLEWSFVSYFYSQAQLPYSLNAISMFESFDNFPCGMHFIIVFGIKCTL